MIPIIAAIQININPNINDKAISNMKKSELLVSKIANLYPEINSIIKNIIL